MPLKNLCPINDLLNLLAAKWTTEILRELSMGPVRTRAFLQHIPGLTMKCLRQRLVILEEFGYVNRQEFHQRPLKVEYTITDKGRKLIGLLSQVKQVADEIAQSTQCTCPVELADKNAFGEFECPSRR